MLLAVYAGLLLLSALALPWWRMENRAPQYGMRVLVIEVSPLGVEGDTKEIDNLGHYVGIRTMDRFAPVERAAAPFAVVLTALAALSLPFLPRGRARLLAALAVAAVPAGFFLDLWFWQRFAVTHLDPHAPLNLIADRVDARVVGGYSVAQFRVCAEFQAGFWLTLAASANVIGFLAVERGPRGFRGGTGSRRAGLPVSAGVAVLVLCAAAPGAAAETVEVGPGTRHPTIAEGVAAAGPGDEVRVRPGTYREHVLIERPLSLVGVPGAIVDGGGTGTVVLVTRGPSIVRGLVVRGSGEGLAAEDAGVKILEAADCAVEDCVVEDALFGILVRSSPRTRVAGNRVTGKDLPVPRRADGIRLQDARGSLVERNDVSVTRDLAIWQSDGCTVRRNVVRDARYGLHYMYCDDNLFEDNVFEGNHTGGAVMYSRRLVLRGNRFSGSRGPSAYGLLLKTADDLLVERNRFTDNTRGIFIDATPSSRFARCTIRANLVGGNDVGVSLEPSVSGAEFTENVFVANRVQVEALGRCRADQNRWSVGGRGNFWSDYVGFDADGDGIGDAPYTLEQFFENLADRWPEAGILRGGPAAEALELAARAFPVVQPRPTLVDDHPLLDPPASAGEPGSGRPRGLLAAAGALAFFGAVGAVAGARRLGNPGARP
jgi:nitrous oxidase accessory protein